MKVSRRGELVIIQRLNGAGSTWVTWKALNLVLSLKGPQYRNERRRARRILAELKTQEKTP